LWVFRLICMHRISVSEFMQVGNHCLKLFTSKYRCIETKKHTLPPHLHNTFTIHYTVVQKFALLLFVVYKHFPRNLYVLLSGRRHLVFKKNSKTILKETECWVSKLPSVILMRVFCHLRMSETRHKNWTDPTIFIY